MISSERRTITPRSSTRETQHGLLDNFEPLRTLTHHEFICAAWTIQQERLTISRLQTIPVTKQSYSSEYSHIDVPV